jgi:hypothetical protein
MLAGLPAGYLKLEEAIIDNKLSLSNTASYEAVDQVKNCLQSVLFDYLNKNIYSNNYLCFKIQESE